MSKYQRLPSPPQWADKLLQWLCPDELLEEIQGDLQELFEERIVEAGEHRARREHVLAVLGYLRPFGFKRKANHLSNPLYTDMFSNSLLIAWRNMVRHKVFSSINILGLALSLAACLLIVVFVIDEWSYDRFHTKHTRIYRVAGFSDRGGGMQETALSNFELGPLLKNDFPFIERIIRIDFDSDEPVQYGEQKFQEKGVSYADDGFFTLFSFPFLQGDAASALSGPNRVVITQKMAVKYFGKANPVGKILEIDELPLKVTGVIEEVPTNAHFHFDFVVSMQTVEKDYPDWMRSFKTGALSHYTYVLLPEGYQPEGLNKQFKSFVKRNLNAELSEKLGYFLQPLTSIHLQSNIEAEIEANGDIRYVYIFVGVALMLILIAGINYTNLATARAIERAKEVGVRKVIGATYRQLIMQFLQESMLTTLLAFMLAFALAWLCMPLFNQLSGKNLSYSWLSDVRLLAGFIGLTLLVGLLAGSYPAFFLARFTAASVLKGSVTKVGTATLLLRRSLVVVQFAASVILIMATLIIYKQIGYIQNKKLGINPSEVVTIPMGVNFISQGYSAVKTDLLQQTGILEVGSISNDLTSGGSSWSQYRVENSAMSEDVNMASMVVDHDFFKTLQAQIIAGRTFSRKYTRDASNAYIINEAAAKLLALDEPIGKPLSGNVFSDGKSYRKQGTIIGVVKDFHFSSLHHQIKPVVFNLQAEESYTWPPAMILVRVSTKDLQQTVANLKNIWRKFSPEKPLQATFLADDIEQLYVKETHFLQVFTVFAGLSILISCLGAFGLAAFTAAQRTKEIGIRKVLGASVSNIMLLLSKDFLKLVVLSTLIAWPLGWWLMRQWLENFAYRIDIPWWVLLVSGVAALLTVLTTVSFQSIKAALTKPVKSLRSE